MAYAISSILESPKSLQQQEFGKKSQAKGEQAIVKNPQHQKYLEQIEREKALDSLKSCLNDNFWLAYDALDACKQVSLVMKGIEMAKELQKAIVRVGTSLIERKEIKVSNYFRYVMIESDYLADVQLFQFPLALQKLGLFIMDAYLKEKKKANQRPLVISVKNSKKGTTLVLAVTGHQRDKQGRNDF
jgi:cell division control protein 45